MSEVTRILTAIEQGDSAAADQLLPLVYDELRKLAVVRLSHEKPGQTLQATALVHEAYLRLVGDGQQWDGRGHFFAAAAESMRRILVDRARQKQTEKHGGHLQRQDLPELPSIDYEPPEELLALDSALSKLELQDPQKAELVKLRYFAGLTVPQAASAMGIAVSTAEKYWTYAKCWLRTETRRLVSKNR